MSLVVILEVRHVTNNFMFRVICVQFILEMDYFLRNKKSELAYQCYFYRIVLNNLKLLFLNLLKIEKYLKPLSQISLFVKVEQE